MILSFHPCFEADQNILCAGRLPDENDLALIRSADAVILPQGCQEPLYRMASQNCKLVFPDYGARFSYPGKLGQTWLFKETRTFHPETMTFDDFSMFDISCGKNIHELPFSYPLVLKLDWGGEGDNVHILRSETELTKLLETIQDYEKTGQKGFLIQKYIPAGGRSLRVVVIYKHHESYWRLHEDKGIFYSSISKGARLDKSSDTRLQEIAIDAVSSFCSRTGINLAGFDILFSSEEETPLPVFLEINYFFGRQGMGGSEVYYKLLVEQIYRWIDDQKIA